MIKLDDVSFYYSDKIILDSISMEIKDGHIYGLIGANGAGKSTLLSCLGNIAHVNYGDISYNGENIIDNLDYIKDTILLDSNFYTGAFNSMKLVYHLAKNKGVEVDYEYFGFLLKKFDINPKTPLRKFSKGNKRLAYLSAILSLDLKNIILDEFIDGIDIVNRKRVKEELLNYCRDKNATIIIASHTTSDINDICDHIILISENQLKRNCTIEELKSLYITYQIVLRENLNIDDLGLNGLKVFRYRSFENIRWITIKNEDDQKALLRELDTIDTKELTTSLEEVIFNEFSL